MIIVILLTVLLLAIALFQALQGLFSAMILLILTILGSAIAFNFYEPLGNLVIGRLGAYAYPSAMLVLFVVPLILLRELFDWKMSGNVVLGQWPDRIGGGVFGLFTGLLMVGMVSIILQMLPFGPSVLGYTPYNNQLQDQDTYTPRWAADFTLGLMEHLSANSMSAMTDTAYSYERAHKNLLLESFGLRNRPEGATANATGDCFQFPELYSLAEQEGAEKFKGDEGTRARLIEETPAYPLGDRGRTTKVYVARVNIGDGAQDADNWYRLPGTHFRLVTQNGNEYFPVGYLTYVGGWRVNGAATADKVAEVAKLPPPPSADASPQPGRFTPPASVEPSMLVARPKKGARLIVDWVFRVPDNNDEKPEYMVFRNSVRQSVPNALVAGLPVSSDPKVGQLALGMKPQSGLVTFPAGKKFLQAESMEFSPKLEGMLPFLSEDTRPQEIRELKVDNDKIRAAVVEGLFQQIVNKGFAAKGKMVGVYFTPPGTSLLQVRLRVNSGLPSDDFKARVAEFKPFVTLSDGRIIGSCGAWIQGSLPSDRDIYLSYDADKPNTPSTIDPAVAAAMVKEIPNSALYVFYFLVPSGSDVSAASVSMGAGRDYEFYPDSPVTP